ncbi:MAG: PilT/PilU family type 4a pilus ATPase [Gemmatimonadetes bacterium]|nr:PilT/PilU family type 4a pilus ATPase [Gemmatimonadota bacterium]
MERIIKAAVDRGATDLHIKAGDVFRARINGQLVPLTKQALTPDQTKAIALRLISNEEDRARIDRVLDYDCSWGASGIGRFRVNILRQRSSFMIVLRVIPFDVPSIEKLGLPPMLGEVALAERGLVIVTGRRGSGKSSTVAALLHHINQSVNRHIVTLESPIEFLHRDLQSSVTQREVGVDTASFREGMRAALRQDPDVIVIGDMSDAESMDTALKAVETGYRVITCLDANDVPSALQRAIALFPAEDQDHARVRLAEALQAVVGLRAVPRPDGHGRANAVELMLVTPMIRNVLVEGARIGELRDLIAQAHDQWGMQTFDQHLLELVGANVITADAAIAAASRPGELEGTIGHLRTRTPLGTRAVTPPAGTPAFLDDQLPEG